MSDNNTTTLSITEVTEYYSVVYRCDNYIIRKLLYMLDS